MKIVIISHTYITEINRTKWKTLVELYPDVEMRVIFPTTWKGALFNHTIDEQNDSYTSRCTFTSLPAFLTGNEMVYGYYPRALYRLLASFKPDIIHVEQGAQALSYCEAIILAKLAKINTKYSFFTWINWIPKRSLKYKALWSLIEWFNLVSSNGAIAGNHDAKEILEDAGFKKPLAVIPQLGVDLQTFYPAHLAEHEKQQTIGFIGRITEEKGVMLLAEAFYALSKQFPTWNLLYVGSGPCEKALLEYCKKHHLLDRVTLKSPVPHEQIARLLQSIKVLVLPSFDTTSWREQFGHVLIEAMACKVPVVGSTGGEIPYVIDRAGLVFQQKNSQSLINGLAQLMKDDMLRSNLAEKGYKRVLENYSNATIARKTYAFWQSLR